MLNRSNYKFHQDETAIQFLIENLSNSNTYLNGSIKTQRLSQLITFWLNGWFTRNTSCVAQYSLESDYGTPVKILLTSACVSDQKARFQLNIAISQIKKFKIHLERKKSNIWKRFRIKYYILDNCFCTQGKNKLNGFQKKCSLFIQYVVNFWK